MSQTETFTGRTYEIVAWANNQRRLIYQEFGSYQGEWVLVAVDDKQYSIYKDWYGSCSGCDSYQASFDYSSDGITKEKAQEFAKDYRAFLEIPRETMKNLLRSGNLASVFPKNIKEGFSEVSLDDVVADTTLAAKLEEGLPIDAAEIVAAKNQEIKQTALRKFGYERFVEEVKPEVISVDEENRLLKTNDILFAFLKDSSTDRRYLLRVPPSMKTVREAVAWSFDMKEGDYSPLIET